mmetsp:Transcript_31837/g.71544  ORF Transcript_31837/g.71544 Transcript_31837/m.71544 type:complete len:285 (+) Transcript_31837:970-1824(+)
MLELLIGDETLPQRQPAPNTVDDHGGELSEQARRVVRSFLDGGVGVNKNGQEDVDEDEVGDKEVGPQEDLQRHSSSCMFHRCVELCGVDVHQEDGEGLGRGPEVSHALVLLPEEEVANDGVANEHDDEQKHEVEQVDSCKVDGAGDHPHPLLEVEGLEQAKDEEDNADPREPRVDPDGCRQVLHLVDEEKEIVLGLVEGAEEPCRGRFVGGDGSFEVGLPPGRVGVLGSVEEDGVVLADGEAAGHVEEEGPGYEGSPHEEEVEPVDPVERVEDVLLERELPCLR